VAACGVLPRVVIPKARHVGVEARAANHPGTVINDPPMPSTAGCIRHAFAAFLAQWPAGEHAPAARGLEAVLREAFADFLIAQGAPVNHRHREVAIEEMLRDARLRHRTKAERV